MRDYRLGLENQIAAYIYLDNALHDRNEDRSIYGEVMSECVANRLYDKEIFERITCAVYADIMNLETLSLVELALKLAGLSPAEVDYDWKREAILTEIKSR